jgi:ribose transport system substrate-binding protein
LLNLAGWFFTLAAMKSLARLLLGCALLASFCAPNMAATKDLQIAVIPKGTTHEFWKAVHTGAVKAQKELEGKGYKINVIWKGPLREDDRDQQIQVVENFINRKVDGIALAPLDSSALVAPVELAANMKIPMVIFDSGLKSDRMISYISTDNYKGGVLGAKRLAELLNGKGKVILVRYQVGSASTEEREAGFLDEMKKYPNINLISTNQYAGATRETAYQVSQTVLTRLGREVDGIFMPNETATVGMMLALRDIKRAGGSVKLVGFDAGSQLIDGLKRGDVQGLVVQNPVKMGYLSVMTLVNYIEKKPVEKKVDTGVVMVTKENMETPEMKDLLAPPVEKYLGRE